MSLLDLYFLTNCCDGAQRPRRVGIRGGGDRIGLLQVGGVGRTFALGQRHRPVFHFRALALVYFNCRVFRSRPSQLGHSVVFVHHGPILLPVFCHGRRSDRPPNALAAGFYPTSIRAPASAWGGLGIGRVGSIIGPLVGGALLTAKWSTASGFHGGQPALLLARRLAAFSLSRLAGMGGSGKGRGR